MLFVDLWSELARLLLRAGARFWARSLRALCAAQDAVQRLRVRRRPGERRGRECDFLCVVLCGRRAKIRHVRRVHDACRKYSYKMVRVPSSNACFYYSPMLKTLD